MSSQPEHNNIHDLLVKAGEAWRAAQPAPLEPQRVYRRASSARLPSSVASIAALVGVVALVAGAVYYTSLPQPAAVGTPHSPVAVTTTPSKPGVQPTSAPTPTEAPLALQVVTEGDDVTAVGVVRDMGLGGLFICRQSGGFASFGTVPPCKGVRLTGVEPGSVPGWSDGHSSVVQLSGVWANGEVAVADVREFTPPPTPTRYAPCPEPPGGWQPDPSPAISDEAAARRLGAELHANPDLYAGTWLASADPRLSSTAATITVVATIGDMETVHDHLQQIYPYNLCVTGAQFGTAELLAAKGRLDRASASWNANVIPPWINRVTLVLPVLDADAAALIGTDSDKVHVDALVAKVLP